jgi:hypothetical protein
MGAERTGILGWPAWVRFGLLGALPIFLVTGSAMAKAIVTGSGDGDGVEAGRVLLLGTSAGFGGGVAYALLGRPFARFGRAGSTLAGAIALFAFLTGCAIAFRVRNVGGIAIAFGAGLSLVGGWILNPGGMEREFVTDRLPHLHALFRDARGDAAEATREHRARLARARRDAWRELERGGRDEEAEPGAADATRLAVEIAALRASPPRTRALAASALLGRDATVQSLERSLEELEAALEALRKETA